MVDQRRVGVGLSVTSRAQAVPQIKIAQAVDISNLFIGRSSIVLVQQLSGYLDVAVSMRRWLKNRCGLSSLEATRGLCRIGPGSLASLAPSGNLRAEGPVHCVTGSPRSTRSALANSGRAPRLSPLCIRALRARWR